MTATVPSRVAREAARGLPRGTSHGEAPHPNEVYLPSAHARALDPDTLLVTGMRGAGKTFWWSALQDRSVRQLLEAQARARRLAADTEVRTGFGVVEAPEDYPGKDVLVRLLREQVEPRLVWRAVAAWQVAKDHPLRGSASWPERIAWADRHPEQIARLFRERDRELVARGRYLLIVFDALDRAADDWKEVDLAVRGLLQTALEFRSWQRLRVKVFLRSDQLDAQRTANFPDASKVLSTEVELTWPRRELYGLLWNCLANGARGEEMRRFLESEEWKSAGREPLFPAPRHLVIEEAAQRRLFHRFAGPWMGGGPKRGFPYTWIPNHLSDARGRVGPRSFLAALRTAAEDTEERHPNHEFALHFESIQAGVREASKIRVAELQEDHPWVDMLLAPLEGAAVPCPFEDLAARWPPALLEQLRETPLPPRRLDAGAPGVRRDLESLGVFSRLGDGRVNIPDIFRVAYGLGRRGGVKPVR